VTFKISKEKFK